MSLLQLDLELRFKVKHFIIISGIQPFLHPDFKSKHVTSVKDSRNITYDFLKNKLPSAARERRKHTYIVVLRRTDNDVNVLYQELDSLITMKIANGTCHQQDNRITRGTCERRTYWFCSVQMNELKTKSYLAEFNVQNRRLCKFSEQGMFELGAKMETRSRIHVDHLEKSSLDWSNRRNCF